MQALAPVHTTMQRWFAAVQAWRLRKKLRALAKWEQERTRGKAGYIVRSALIYSLIMTAASDLFGVGLDGEDRFARFWFNAISYTLGGIVVGVIGWAARERDYRNAVREIRLEAIAAGQALNENGRHAGLL